MSSQENMDRNFLLVLILQIAFVVSHPLELEHINEQLQVTCELDCAELIRVWENGEHEGQDIDQIFTHPIYKCKQITIGWR